MRADYRTRLKGELLQVLQAHKHDAMTAKEIAMRLAQRGTAVNLATVYRHLDRLVEDKALVKSVPENGKGAVYLWSEAGACYGHLHMQCTRCGRLMHLDCHDVERFMAHLSQAHGFALSLGKTILYGKCHDCQKSKEAL